MTDIHLIERISQLELIVTGLQNEINELKDSVTDIASKRNEMYYQKFLEKYFSATHKKTKFGITDISTDTHHIEIKHWRQYKHALGQLLSYNEFDNKQLSAYFYGSINQPQKSNIIQLFQNKNISIYEFVDTLDGIKIQTVLDLTIVEESPVNPNDFYTWLNGKIKYSPNGFMSLEDICSTFLNQTNIHSFIKSKYRNVIEKFIKDNFKQSDVKWQFQHVWVNDKSDRGWKNLIFIEESFFKWLDAHVEYKQDSILTLSDICTKLLGDKVGPRILSKYKYRIEFWISYNHQNVNSKFQDSTFNGVNYKGWINLCLK